MKNNEYEISDFFTDEEFDNISEMFCPSGLRENCTDIDLGCCEECWKQYLNKEIKKMVKEKKSINQIEKYFNDTLKSIAYTHL